MTRIEFIDQLLRSLRVNPFRGNTLAWLTLTVNEYGSMTDGAKNNPCDTTLPMPGSTDYNSVGVQDYVSPSQGVAATASTVSEPRYATAMRRMRGPILDPIAHAEGFLSDLSAAGWGSINLALVKQVEAKFNFYAELEIPA